MINDHGSHTILLRSIDQKLRSVVSLFERFHLSSHLFMSHFRFRPSHLFVSYSHIRLMFFPSDDFEIKSIYILLSLIQLLFSLSTTI